MRAGRLALAALLTLACTACGALPEVSGTPSSTAPRSVVDRVRDTGTLRVGIKVDQPGLGYRASPGGAPQGFDVDVAAMVAARLGVKPDRIEWVETVSKNREKFLRNGTVDLLVASYPITDARRIVVGQAGPYDVTGVQMLVRADDDSTTGPGAVKGKRVCSVQGSSAIRVFQQDLRVRVEAIDTYSACVDRLLARTTDVVAAYGDILRGYVTQDAGKVKIVGDTLDEGRFGIDYPKGDTALCRAIDATLSAAFAGGSWKRAYERNLHAAAPPPPTLDPCL